MPLIRKLHNTTWQTKQNQENPPNTKEWVPSKALTFRSRACERTGGFHLLSHPRACASTRPGVNIRSPALVPALRAQGTIHRGWESRDAGRWAQWLRRLGARPPLHLLIHPHEHQVREEQGSAPFSGEENELNEVKSEPLKPRCQSS